jgi:hypothetical protein
MRHSALRYTSNGVIDHKLLTGNLRNVNGRYQAITLKCPAQGHFECN